ncbi:MAG: hypothetical protein LBK53_04355 [Heliobacteriaceae bacterium]|jgi:Fe-S-cluster containining protein|nr:hypothetical protein [Heliobacteriaceae bacterium]
MLERYKNFLKEFDKKLERYFFAHREYIKCRAGCTGCCELGGYPFSRLEAEYIMSAFVRLPVGVQGKIKNNIGGLVRDNTEDYRCPFLIDGLCAAYEYRGIVCRTFGLAYLDKGTVRLPECAREGLNYSSLFNPETNEIQLQNPVKEILRTDLILRSPLAQRFKLEPGEIRPLIKWF